MWLPVVEAWAYNQLAQHIIVGLCGGARLFTLDRRDGRGGRGIYREEGIEVSLSFKNKYQCPKDFWLCTRDLYHSPVAPTKQHQNTNKL